MLSIATLLKESKIYLDKPYIKVAYHPHLNIIIHSWNGFASYNEILEVGKRTLEAVQKEHATRVLYDTRGLEVLDDKSRNYISIEFTIKMIRAGINFSATIMPEDPFAQFSIEEIRNRMERYLPGRVKYFNSVNKAIDWLVVAAHPQKESNLVSHSLRA